MYLFKDSQIKACIKGIKIILNFNQGKLKDYKVCDDLYDDIVTLNLIKDLIKDNKTTFDGSVVAIITSTRSIIYDNQKDGYTVLDHIIDFVENKQVNKLKLIIYGLIEDPDTDNYDEFYDCSLCKHFYDFYRCPKVKLREDISTDEYLMILSNWLDIYFFSYVLINGYKTPLLDVTTNKVISKDVISRFDDGQLYYKENNSWLDLDERQLKLTADSSIPQGKVCWINDKIIKNNVEV